MQKLSLLFLLIIPFLSSCGPNYLYEEDHEIDSTGWTYENILNFSFDIQDTLAVYNLFLEIEHSTDYAKQNLYTRISTTFPSGKKLEKILSLELADKSGFWLGDCGGKNCELRLPIQEGAFFNETGTYAIALEQYMRESPVQGIQEIGFKLEKTGDRRQ